MLKDRKTGGRKGIIRLIQPGDFTSLISQHFSSTSSDYNLQMHRDFTSYFKLLKKKKKFFISSYTY